MLIEIARNEPGSSVGAAYARKQGYMPLLRSFIAFLRGSTDMPRLRRCGSDFVLWEFFNRLLG